MFLGEIDVGHSWDLKGINLGVWETAHLPLPYDDDKKRGQSLLKNEFRFFTDFFSSLHRFRDKGPRKQQLTDKK